MKCRVVTDFPDRFRRGLRVYLGSRQRATRIRSASVSGPTVLLAFAGVPDRQAAEALRGLEVLVDRRDAVPLPEGEFFWQDVIGLGVLDETGAPLGTVVDIIETGANDVYVVHGERGEWLVPAIKDTVRSISPADGQMVVHLLAGMEPTPIRSRVAGSAPARTRRRGRSRRPSPPSTPPPVPPLE